MAAGVSIRHKRKTSDFSNGELAAGELGLNTNSGIWFYSIDGANTTNLSALYQALLVSGTNIKTINGTSILGSGDIVAGGGMTLLAVHYHNSISYSLTATAADVHATNAAITFTAPASGNVLIEVKTNIKALTLDAFDNVNLGLRISTTNVTNSLKKPDGLNAAYNSTDGIYHQYYQVYYRHILTGLTPTTSYTYKLAAKANTTGVADVVANSTVGCFEMAAFAV